MRRTRRLYVTGVRAQLRFHVASTMAEATAFFGAEARVPDSDEVRVFWARTGIGHMNDKQRMEKFGVSRQTVNNWRRKGGPDLQTIGRIKTLEYKKKLEQTIAVVGLLPINEMVNASGIPFRSLRTVAKNMGIKFPSAHRPISDEKMVELATGKTWREFANATGFKLASLRQYVYSRPELAAAIRKVRKPAGCENLSRGKRSALVQKIRDMGHMGVSAYRIAETLGIEMMSVRYHLLKMGKENPDEFYAPYGNKRKTGEPVAGSDGGVADRQ